VEAAEAAATTARDTALVKIPVPPKRGRRGACGVHEEDTKPIPGAGKARSRAEGVFCASLRSSEGAEAKVAATAAVNKPGRMDEMAALAAAEDDSWAAGIFIVSFTR